MLKIMAAIVKAKVCLIVSSLKHINVLIIMLNTKYHHVIIDFVVIHSCISCCTVLLATHCQHLHFAVCICIQL